MYKCKNKQKSPHVFPWRERSYPGNVQKSSRELVKARWSQWLNVVVLSPSGVQLFANPWTAALQASLSLTVSQSLLKLRSIELVMPSNHLILCHPFLLLPSNFPSIRVFSNESVLKSGGQSLGSFSFSTSPSSEYSVIGQRNEKHCATEESDYPEGRGQGVIWRLSWALACG